MYIYAADTHFQHFRLAARLPQASVKASPKSGWFFGAALPDDLPSEYPPSDFPHFSSGTSGNAVVDSSLAEKEFVLDTLYDLKGLLSLECMATQGADKWWTCAYLDKVQTRTHSQHVFART